MSDSPATRFAKAGDVRIAYQLVGDGPLDLVFLWGGQFIVDLAWEEPRLARFLRRLSSFSRLVVMDARGWGASRFAGDEKSPALETWADDLQLVMDAAGMGQAAVVGWSTGGSLAMFYAASRPDRISRVALIGAFARLLEDDDYPAGTPRSVFEAGGRSFVEGYGTGADIAYFAPSMLGDEPFRHWWARCERLANGAAAAQAGWEEVTDRDLRPVLPTLQIPTLVLHSRGDRFIPVGHGRYLGEHIPGARYVELDGRDHFFFTEGSDQLLDELESFLAGSSGGLRSDRALAAVLFTDIVASTDMASALGDQRWRELLDHHDALVSSEVQRFRGRVVKTTGDGVLATFDGPARAIRCACALRDSAHTLGLELRQGIHVGEIERRGSDVGGIAVNMAARVQAAAGVGEVIVSRVVADLVVGSGIELEDRGEHELKGIPGQWQLLAVSA